MPDTLSFPHIAVGDTAHMDLAIGNTGTELLDVTGVASSEAVFVLDASTFTVAPGEQTIVTVTYLPVEIAEHAGTIVVESNDPDEGTIAVVVTGQASNNPPADSTEVDVMAVAAPETPQQHTELPRQTALHPNVPNPFNPTTTVSYDIARETPVRVVIYNVRGQVVRTLVSGVTPPGRYAVMWNGTSDRGTPVATGVYFCRLVAGDMVQVRKMVLLK